MGILAGAFTAKEAARIANVPYQTLVTWSTRGGIAPAPSIRDATGTGKPGRLYSFTDLVELRAIRGLRDMGVSAQALRKVKATLSDFDIDAPLAYLVVSEDGESISIEYDDGAFMELLKNRGQISYRVLDVGHIAQEITEIAGAVLEERKAAVAGG